MTYTLEQVERAVAFLGLGESDASGELLLAMASWLIEDRQTLLDQIMRLTAALEHLHPMFPPHDGDEVRAVWVAALATIGLTPEEAYDPRRPTTEGPTGRFRYLQSG